MSPFPGFNVKGEEEPQVITYSELTIESGRAMTASAQCNQCGWCMEITNINVLKHIADIEDLQDRAEEHGKQHSK